MNGCGMWGEPMAKIEFKGIDEYAKRLGILWKEERGILEEAVYKGAEVVADEIKKACSPFRRMKVSEHRKIR